MKTKNLLFISWDGPQTSYMEGLFMPIFQEIAKVHEINFHVLQFTWADHEKMDETKRVAEKMNIHYTALPILRKPTASLGSLLTVFSSVKKIEKYILENHIDIVMPRSTFPAMMVNRIKNRNFKLIFDADGLPLEERIDFSGLKKNSFQYKLMKSAETKMLINADAVMTRSQKAIDIHIGHISEHYRNKFSVVKNGRDPSHFSFDQETRTTTRKKLGLNDELLFVYAGSLGPQYGLSEMLEIFHQYAEKKPSKFLILTGNTDFAEKNIPEYLKSEIIIKKVASSEVSHYLNAADLAFAIREPAFSMQGVAPIKLGEYLLCGLPVIASKGIGDTEEILRNFTECFLYDHSLPKATILAKSANFSENAIFADRNSIAAEARKYFSLDAAAASYLSVLQKI